MRECFRIARPEKESRKQNRQRGEVMQVSIEKSAQAHDGAIISARRRPFKGDLPKAGPRRCSALYSNRWIGDLGARHANGEPRYRDLRGRDGAAATSLAMRSTTASQLLSGPWRNNWRVGYQGLSARSSNQRQSGA